MCQIQKIKLCKKSGKIVQRVLKKLWKILKKDFLLEKESRGEESEKSIKKTFLFVTKSMNQCGKVLNKRGKKGKNVENMW